VASAVADSTRLPEGRKRRARKASVVPVEAAPSAESARVASSNRESSPEARLVILGRRKEAGASLEAAASRSPAPRKARGAPVEAAPSAEPATVASTQRASSVRSLTARSARLVRQEVADLSPKAHAPGTPTRSETQEKGAEERSAVDRVVGLDLGEKISYCEVKDEQVVERATVAGVSDLVRLLGPNTPSAKVAFEACREAWVVYDQLVEWGHEPQMIDTTP